MLTLIRGLPGAGKSTLARTLQAGASMLGHARPYHFEADMFHMVGDEYIFLPENIKAAHEWCQAETRKYLDFGCPVIVSNTFTTLKEMAPYFSMAYEFKVKVQVIECKGDFGSIHDVPQDALDRMRDRWEEMPLR